MLVGKSIVIQINTHGYGSININDYGPVYCRRESAYREPSRTGGRHSCTPGTGTAPSLPLSQS